MRAEFGEVFTRRWVVDIILDLVGYTSDKDLKQLRLIEPACGAGAFLVPAVERLVANLRTSDFRDPALTRAIAAFDVRADNVSYCRAQVATALESGGAEPDAARHLARQWVRHEDYLLSARAAADLLDTGPAADADFVVGNPPYIRLEDIPEELYAEYRRRWPSMSGRADIYVGFFERALRSLRPGGKLAFICADRWMRNQYGAGLRTLVAEGFRMEAIWTMHDVDAFERPVSAYPAITVISRQPPGPAVVADTSREFDAASARQLAHWTTAGDLATVAGPGYQAHRLPHWFPGNEMWPAGDPGRLALIEYLNDHFLPLHSPAGGTRVGIGVATGADKIYITEDRNLVEPDRLLPLAMVADTRAGSFRWGGKYLVNPWGQDGSLVDLEDFTRLRRYLETHAAQLRSRHTAKAHPRSWFRTIDRVNNDLIHRPKILIQDMRTSINPVLEPGGHYPHHNLYYVVSDSWNLEVLGGILLSRVTQAFIEAYCVRMRGNTLRFQAQYLKKIRVPHPRDLDTETTETLRTAFRERDQDLATQAARKAYRLDSSFSV